MMMNEHQFKQKTKDLALRSIRISQALARTKEAEVIGTQLLRCGTSVGANYRSACRAKSKADMIAKLAIVEEEADETLFWAELLIESGILPEEKLALFMTDVESVVKMVVKSIQTLKAIK
jgi:four helix bundle protein